MQAMKRQNKQQTARRRDAWLTTRERKRSTEQMNEGESSLLKIEININGPVDSVVFLADSAMNERRES